MNARQNPLYWSFGLGTWFGTRVRVSVFFPLCLFLLCWKLGFDHLALGLSVSGILFVSVLLHEFGHVFAARRTGGFSDEILIWPLGGLAFVEPAKNFWAHFLTAAAGPLVNLALCAITFPWVFNSPHFGDVWNPLYLPGVSLESRLFSDLCVLTFALNWVLLLLNLIPIFPLDGGRMLQSWLSTRWGAVQSADISIRVGLVAAVLLGVVGVLANAIWIVGLSFLIIIMAIQENQRIQSAEMYDESFMGYDFSQGYTSLEKSQPPPPAAPPSPLQQWRERRKAEKRKRQEEQEQQAEVQLDAILAKLHEQGMAALTDTEKRLLNRASARYRGKGKPQA
jgi:Zn-dependent protease